MREHYKLYDRLLIYGIDASHLEFGSTVIIRDQRLAKYPEDVVAERRYPDIIPQLRHRLMRNGKR